MSQLILGDCIKEICKLESESIDQIVTDPSYFTGNAQDFKLILDELKRVLKPAGKFFYFSDKLQKLQLQNDNWYLESKFICVDPGVEPSDEQKYIEVWHKSDPDPDISYGNTSCHLLTKNSKIIKDFYVDGDNKSDAIVSRKSESDTNHNQYILNPADNYHKLIEIIIDKYSNPSDVILDPFAGIGNTLLACKKLNRRCIAYEKNPEQYKIAKSRLEHYND